MVRIVGMVGLALDDTQTSIFIRVNFLCSSLHMKFNPGVMVFLKKCI